MNHVIALQPRREPLAPLRALIVIGILAGLVSGGIISLGG
jgi:hypothetical protein